MSPLQIDILFWYHVRCNDYRDGDMSAPAVREALDFFVHKVGLLEVIKPETRIEGDDRSYRCTDRARAYLDAIQAMPLPVCRWEIPETI